MATYKLIASSTVGSGGASSITFSSIPGTYTDLVLKLSIRDVTSGMRVRFNSDSGANYSWRRIQGDGSSVVSNKNSDYGSPYDTFFYHAAVSITTDTASTFGNGEIYIPNYAGSNYKSISSDGVEENNGSSARAALMAGLWSSSSAITSITITSDNTSGNNIQQYSTAYLYGISNA